MLGLSRLEIEGAGLLVLLASFLIWLGFHDAAVKREAVAPILANVQAVADAASAAATIKAAQVIAGQAGNLSDAKSTIAAQAADLASARSAVAVAYRLRDDALRRAAAASHPGSAPGGQTGGDTGTDLVSWGLYASALGARAEAESDAADLAGYSSGLRVSGGLCVRDYRSLK